MTKVMSSGIVRRNVVLMHPNQVAIGSCLREDSHTPKMRPLTVGSHFHVLHECEFPMQRMQQLRHNRRARSIMFELRIAFGMLSQITSVITEPEPAIIHSKTTRKSGFACITLLSYVVRRCEPTACQSPSGQRRKTSLSPCDKGPQDQLYRRHSH